jgi:hypothetical protein
VRERSVELKEGFSFNFNFMKDAKIQRNYIYASIHHILSTGK